MPSTAPPDELGAELVAVGLIRATADGLLPGATADEQRVRQCLNLVEGWLGGPSAGERGELRDPLLQVLDALARSAATYLVHTLGGDTKAAEEWLADQSRNAGDAAREAGDPHPAAPVTLALAWLYVEAQAADARDISDADHERLQLDRVERHAGHCDMYVREEHVSRDAYDLVLTSARLAATILVHMAGRDRQAVAQQLDHQAAELMRALGSETPKWVPDNPADLGNQG